MRIEIKTVILGSVLSILLNVGITITTNQVNDAVQTSKIVAIEKKIDEVKPALIKREFEHLRVAVSKQGVRLDRQAKDLHQLEISHTRAITVLENLTTVIKDFTVSQKEFHTNQIEIKQHLNSLRERR